MKLSQEEFLTLSERSIIGNMTHDTAEGSTVLALPTLYGHSVDVPLNSLSHCWRNVRKSCPDMLASIAANLKDLLNHFASGNEEVGELIVRDRSKTRSCCKSSQSDRPISARFVGGGVGRRRPI